MMHFKVHQSVSSLYLQILTDSHKFSHVVVGHYSVVVSLSCLLEEQVHILQDRLSISQEDN